MKKILFIMANPKNTARLRLDEEIRDIAESLNLARHREHFRIEQRWATRLKDVRRAIFDVNPHILHFSGHGEAEGLLLEDDSGNAVIANADALAGLFRIEAGQIECVVLNACHSIHLAKAINAHVKYVIAMPNAIPDQAAREFAVGFYDAFGAGKGVKHAFDSGCGALRVPAADFPALFTSTQPIRPSSRPRTPRNDLLTLMQKSVQNAFEETVHIPRLLALEKREQPAEVERVCEVLVETSDRKSRYIEQDEHLIDLFERMNHQLLILGNAGAGKTTAMLELARDALFLAEEDETQPIPVMFKLSSWAKDRKPLDAWMGDYLNLKYQMRKLIGQEHLAQGHILFLLDGLDEVPQKWREACVNAITNFCQSHEINGIVVSSRPEEYDALTVKLKLEGAILLEPLTKAQIETYLEEAGEALAPVRAALQEDAQLVKLLDTPMMLDVMASSYLGEESAQMLTEQATLEERRANLFHQCAARMLSRKNAKPGAEYAPQDALRWLAWLAENMLRHHCGLEFFPEIMQPTWLSPRKRWLYYSGVSILGGLTLLFGMLSGFSVVALISHAIGEDLGSVNFARMFTIGGYLGATFMLSSLLTLRCRPAVSIPAAALIGGALWGMATARTNGRIAAAVLLFALFAGLPSLWANAKERIRIVEVVNWSWKGVFWGLMAAMPVFAAIGVALCAASNPSQDLLAIGVLAGALFPMAGGLWHQESAKPENAAARRGIWRPARNALCIIGGCMLSALTISVAVGLLTNDENFLGWLSLGLILGPIIGMIFGMRSGITPCIQHIALRLALRDDARLPVNVSRFLEYAARRAFVKKEGGGYLFHESWAAYFASLREESFHEIVQHLERRMTK